MIDLFRSYLQERILTYMQSEYSDFVCKSTGKKMQFSKQLNNGITVFILFRFFADKDYVIPNFLWTRKSKVPTEDCIDSSHYDQFEEDWSVLDGDDEVFLSATEFGYFSNAFDLDCEYARLDRLKELFSDGKADAVKDLYQIRNWEEERAYHSWDMIEELFPGSIKADDIEGATKNMLEDVLGLLGGKYKEYLGYLDSTKSM
ncbi:hypothetical protein [Oceanobacter mangrovi]|uniref:hypothetical protein n=1 Tax=Oceanobacter mangrovi TaxID=2862510 RepID=UPI001C8E7667|nr:hypothetical protein [Oceanobacter mangrovi]